MRVRKNVGSTIMNTKKILNRKHTASNIDDSFLERCYPTLTKLVSRSNLFAAREFARKALWVDEGVAAWARWLSVAWTYYSNFDEITSILQALSTHRTLDIAIAFFGKKDGLVLYTGSALVLESDCWIQGKLSEVLKQLRNSFEFVRFNCSK